ncbi:SRPBCC family protein [Arthrobacter sp. H35-D1]|uniref:SRPBCC family protein n=1 Tax=Arthrobacter sp. H35-D1 TaxID=3046202 RepID=UPI0024BBA799|nr:SRPBCC family protein [Arthrobacter sp. H35-D1]MDJ0315494.1 SRPBCC family protein [Arthrobacter sp. H35-D1]
MSTFSVERSTVISAPVESIYPMVENFREWTRWSPWESIDPTMEHRYEGPIAGVGAKYAWKGKSKAGVGTMQIMETTLTTIRIRLEFTKPMKAVNPTTFTFAAEGAGTRVTWTMTGESTGLNRLFLLFMNMDKMVGKDFEKGLAQLGGAVSGHAQEHLRQWRHKPLKASAWHGDILVQAAVLSVNCGCWTAGVRCSRRKSVARAKVVQPRTRSWTCRVPLGFRSYRSVRDRHGPPCFG